MESSYMNPLTCTNTMVSEPFYFSHFLTFFSYTAIRISYSQTFSPDFAAHLLHRELQALVTFLVLLAIKFVREETWQGFVADALFFAKGFLMILALVVDYHLAFCYLICFFVIFALSQQPPYQGLGNSNKLTPLQLEVSLTEGSTSKLWLVEFQASWSSTCIRTSQFFSDLSITIFMLVTMPQYWFGPYQVTEFERGLTPHVRFLVIGSLMDVGLFPNVAEKFGISLGVSMGQLPTFILFDSGVEIARFPEVEREAKAYHPPITRKLLCRHFELDRRLIEYIHVK